MFLPKLPSPPRPWRPCLLAGAPLPRTGFAPFRRRRRLVSPFASSSSGSHSKDSPLPPAKPSSSKKAPNDIGRWKAVPPGMRESAVPYTEEPPRWSARRTARVALRKVASSVPRKARSVVLLNLVTFIFASNISVVKEAETMLDPDLFNMLSLAYLAQAIGLVTADAGRSSFISALTVIIVPFLDGLLGAVVPAYTWLGAFFSLVGVSMLELSGSPPCVSLIIYMNRTEHISRNMKKENFLTLIGCEVGILSKHFCSEFFSPIDKVAAMRDVSATETAIIYGLEPVWGAAFAWTMFGERWGIMGFLGAILIIVGSLMVQILGSIPDVPRGDSYQMNS
ncbi:hypothetical protein PR202_ga17224 [Eleusine coracana subsp. coracana]|uniref:EamA domain-containing protein n=1 Tax=Eleusine coracana subsp. coracana TaxID=191504 RepID=A0AAV5CQD7_ELECO|nr:hypothetical protein PR202_ga17224 [Eleusine coracana subsp. coracana]